MTCTDQPASSTVASSVQRTGPIWVGYADLATPQPQLISPLGLSPADYHAARVLLFDGSSALNWHEAPTATFTSTTFSALRRHYQTRSRKVIPLVLPTAEPTLTIAICTREHPELLERCLRSLAASPTGHPILVVDNAPVTTRTKDLITHFARRGLPVTRVVEPRPGLSHARNRALLTASTEVVAFTDDDVVVHPTWSAMVAQAFSLEPSATIVTGPVPPAQLDSPAQRIFESRLSWSLELQSRVFARAFAADFAWPFPFSAGHFGTGANMAIRRSWALEHGGFNVALGAGTATRGGEDLEMFVRVILEGGAIAYDASAVVWHVHLADANQVASHLRGYGAGFTAYLTACALSKHGPALLRALPSSTRAFTRQRAAARKTSPLPPDIRRAEVKGMLHGPIAYVRTVLATRSGFPTSRAHG